MLVMSYEEEIKVWRGNRERNLRDGITIGDMLWSPVPESERENLKLHFFPINTEFRFTAKLTLLETQRERILSKPDGGATDPFLEVGHVEFVYNNDNIRLFVVFDKQTNGYYLGFKDFTCGKESYSNGRLLLIEDSNRETITLDFNKAFNFACAYDVSSPCPLIPEENWLKFPIRAGEMKYH